MTWQPGSSDSVGEQPPTWVSVDSPPTTAVVQVPSRSRHRLGWTAVVLLLGISLCGLAASAVGVAHEVLPRRFTAAQQQRIMTWEMTRRWRALTAGKLFPARMAYSVPGTALNSIHGLSLDAQRLAIAPQSSCTAAVSAAAAAVLAASHCTAVLRATYVDSSGSLVATVGIAVLPNSAAAMTAARELSAPHGGLALGLRALPVKGTAASTFRDRQRQLMYAESDGPYVILSTAGFTDGRHHVRLAADPYYDHEMTSLLAGLAKATGGMLGATPAVPRCPGAPGC